MRTIKFRGKRLNGKWKVSGTLTQMQDGRIRLGGYAVYGETLSQFTGLYDRNDKEIYEGDILELSDRNTHIELVVVEHGYYGWTFYNPQTVKFNSDGSHAYRAVENARFMFGTGKVVGNIYDNPELMRGGSNYESSRK